MNQGLYGINFIHLSNILKHIAIICKIKKNDTYFLEIIL